MFKTKTVVGIVIFAVAAVGSGIYKANSPLFYFYGESGPLHFGEKNNLHFFACNRSTRITNMSLCAYITGASESETCFYYQVPKTYENYEKKEYAIEIASSLLRLGINTIRLALLNYGNVYHQTTFRLFCRDFSLDRIVIQPDQLDSDYVGFQDYVKFNSLAAHSYYRDIFSFEDFTPFKTRNYYHRLDISSFSFFFYNDYCENNLSYENSYLEIEENQNFQLYRYLSPDNYNGFRRLNTRIERDLLFANHYMVKLDQKLYVNPYTLIMSSTPLDGFVETRYFYFPKAYYDDCHITDFRLVITGLTINLYDLKYSFSYETDKPLLGNCSIAQYCIETSVGSDVSFPSYEEVIK